jgi:UDP-N-acetylglucosamine 2-epimerase
MRVAEGDRRQVEQGYQGGAVSTKVVRIVLSYIDQVNHTVWSKPGPF